MESKLKMIGTTLIVLGVAGLLYEDYQHHRLIEELQSKQAPNVIETEKLIDSLETQLFIATSTNGRYEMTLEHLYEVNPEAAKEFDEYYNQETE